MFLIRLLTSKAFKKATLVLTLVNLVLFIGIPFGYFGFTTLSPALKAADITFFEVVLDKVPEAKMNTLENKINDYAKKSGSLAAINVANLIPTYEAGTTPPKQITPNLEQDTKGLFEYQQQLQKQGLQKSLNSMNAVLD